MTIENSHAMGADRAPAISAEGFAELVDMVGAELPDVVIDLLDTYLEESAGLVDVMLAARAQGNEAEMLRPAHSLKSISATVGAAYLSELCAALEAYVRGDAEPMDVAAQVQQIQTEHGRVEEALEQHKASLRAGQRDSSLRSE